MPWPTRQWTDEHLYICTAKSILADIAAHLGTNEVPSLAVLHKVHLAKGALAKHLDWFIFLHPVDREIVGSLLPVLAPTTDKLLPLTVLLFHKWIKATPSLSFSLEDILT